MVRKGFSKSAKAKPAKKRSRSASPKGKKKGKKGSAKRSQSLGKLPTAPPDMLSPDAMRNLYYIAHDAPDALVLRGFNWDGTAPKKKKKGGGGKKKGKKKK